MWNDATNANCKACLTRKARSSKGAHGTTKPSSGSGGWMCSKCTLWNDSTNVNCKACMTKNTAQKIDLREEQQKLNQIDVVNPSLSVRFKAFFSRPPPQWTCPLCTYINSGIAVQCQSCRYLKQTEEEEESSSFNTDSNGGSRTKEEKKSRKNGSTLEEPSPSVFDSVKAIFRRPAPNGPLTKRVVGEKVPAKASEKEEDDGWRCVQCTLKNPYSVDKCSACDIARDIDLSSLRGDSRSDAAAPKSNRDTRNTLDSGYSTRKDDSVADTRSNLGSKVETDTEDVLTPLLALRPLVPEAHRQKDFLSSQGSPTWLCKVCGAYNIVSVRRCYICNIGVVPECYQAKGNPVINPPQATVAPTHQRHNPQNASSKKKGSQQVVVPEFHQTKGKVAINPPPPILAPTTQQAHRYDPQNVLPKEKDTQRGVDPLHSKDQDYVNVPLQQASPNRNQSSPSSSPHHPLTHVNHLQASSSLSPLHITSSDSSILPQSEQKHPIINGSSQLSRNSLSPQHNDNKLEQSLWYQSSQNGLSASIQPYYGDSLLEESQFDPYSRPRTPTEVRMERCHRGGAMQANGAGHRQRQRGEGGGERARCPVEASVTFNRTKYVSERRHEDVLQASTVYRDIQRYCRKVGEIGMCWGTQHVSEGVVYSAFRFSITACNCTHV